MLTKTPCQHCQINIEFDVEREGEFVACPNCGQQTRLILEVKKSEPAPKPAAPVKRRETFERIILRLLVIVSAIGITYYAFWFDASVKEPGSDYSRIINTGLESDRLLGCLFWGFMEISCLIGLVRTDIARK